jgi:hypothetical protein
MRISDGWDQHMDRYCGSPQYRASLWARCWFVTGWQDSTNPLSQLGSQSCDLHTATVRVDQGGNGKASANVKDDPDDIPMIYLQYVVLVIVVLLNLPGINCVECSISHAPAELQGDVSHICHQISLHPESTLREPSRHFYQ